MINNITALGYGIIAFAVLIGVGLVVLAQLASTIASCPTGYTYQANTTATFSTGKCCLTAGTDCASTGNYTDPSTASQNVYTIYGTYIGTNLVSWIPLVIVMVIGLMFLGYFLARKGSKA